MTLLSPCYFYFWYQASVLIFEATFSQVFMLLPWNMLAVVIIWGVYNWRAFPNSFFSVFFAHLSWLLHHVWASFSNWAPCYSCSWLCLLLVPCRVQSFCTIFHSRYPKAWLVIVFCYEIGDNYYAVFWFWGLTISF